MDSYLEEFTFRFNRRTSRHRGKLFYRLVQQAVAVKPAPYKALIKSPEAESPGSTRSRANLSQGNMPISEIHVKDDAFAISVLTFRV